MDKKQIVKQIVSECKNNIPNISDTELGEEYSYNSLVLCIIDAVFSIGVRYSSTAATVHRYMEYKELPYSYSNNIEHTVNEFIQNVDSFDSIETFAKIVLQNMQRTSSTNGILKAIACYNVANVLRKFGINTLEDFRNFPEYKKAELDKNILNVKGQASGIMLKYLYMLAGNDEMCKPDRHIHRFITNIAKEKFTDAEIQQLLTEVCLKLKETYPGMTVRLLDNKIWKYQKSLKATK